MTRLLSACAAVALATSSSAFGMTFSFVPGGSSAQPGYTIIDKFETSAGLTGTNFQIKAPPSDSDGAVPAFASPYGTSYLSVLSGGSATYVFAQAAKNVQFDWGSIDTYNTLTVTMASGATYAIVPGGNFINQANGDQSSKFTNGLFTVNAGTDRISALTFGSSGNSFEIDNLAVAGVPEPAVWGMIILGFGAIGFSSRRRRYFASNVTA